MELLMSVTVLILVVMMLALIFQQTNTAWGVGTRKTGSETALRMILSVLERDLSHAVDDTKFGGGLNSFSSAPTFVSLEGTNRLPVLIKYSINGSDLTREVYSLIPSAPSKWTQGAQISSASVNGGLPLSSCTFTPIYGPPNTLPLFLTIEAHVSNQGSIANVSGWSEGRNQSSTDKIQANP